MECGTVLRVLQTKVVRDAAIKTRQTHIIFGPARFGTDLRVEISLQSHSLLQSPSSVQSPSLVQSPSSVQSSSSLWSFGLINTRPLFLLYRDLIFREAFCFLYHFVKQRASPNSSQVHRQLCRTNRLVLALLVNQDV